jgi:hypothetical protein
MPSSKAHAPTIYTIFMDGKTHRGTAQKLMTQIHSDVAKRSQEVAKIGPKEYASKLIEDAPFHLDRNLLAYLSKEDNDTDFDRALRYLAEMEPSGVRILARQEG